MRSCWLLQRLICLYRGHRALTTCATYSARSAGGRLREVRYCLACDSLVWVEQPPGATKLNGDECAWNEQ